MEQISSKQLVSLNPREPIWTRFFMVAPLVVVGTKEGDHYNLAPKHMVTPVGWDNYFPFVCTSRHSTYRNVRESGCFTVSFPSRRRSSWRASLRSRAAATNGRSRASCSCPRFRQRRSTAWISGASF